MANMRTKVREILDLLRDGYAPYRGPVEGTVYEGVDCRTPKAATWFCKGRTYICLGCARHCTLAHPSGFQLTLPRTGPRTTVVFAELPSVTVEDLLATGRPLRPDEAAWVLNVSRREVYELVDEGRLEPAGGGRPLRVTSDSVRRELGL